VRRAVRRAVPSVRVKVRVRVQVQVQVRVRMRGAGTVIVSGKEGLQDGGTEAVGPAARVGVAPAEQGTVHSAPNQAERRPVD
jgi:hypothetical protein